MVAEKLRAELPNLKTGIEVQLPKAAEALQKKELEALRKEREKIAKK